MKKPIFKDDEEAARFWETHEPMDYMSETTLVEAPRPPKSQAISLRLDPTILGLAKRIARRKGIGYQTLIKIWITEAVSREMDRGVSEPMERILNAWAANLPSLDTTSAPIAAPVFTAPETRQLTSAEER